MEKFASTLKLTKSTRSGRPETFTLLPHARRHFANLFGWKRPDGTRLYRKDYWSMARKNAKTQNIAFAALCLLFLDKEAQPEVYAVATETEQAGECYEAARDMVRSNPELESMVIIRDYRKEIEYPANGGLLKVLSSKGKSKHGSNPSGVIFDELHAWGAEHQELYDALTTGSGARRQPLRMMITTAGTEENSICGREYDYAKQVLSREVEDPTYFADIYELPKDADWTDEKLWSLPNPAIDHFPNMRQMLREEVAAALHSPAKQNTVRRLYFNQWTASEEQWIPLHAWDACKDEIDTAALKDTPCYGGLDLGAVSDLTAFALVWPDGGNVTTKVWQFLPEDDLEGRSRRDGVTYDRWADADEKYLILTPGNVTSWEFVTNYIAGVIAPQFNIRAIAFDRAGARDTATRLQESGFEMLDWGQGFLSMTAPSKRVEELVLAGRMRHDGNPLLRWNVDCCSIATDPAGNIKPVKPSRRKSKKRIDGLVAVVMATGLAMKMGAMEVKDLAVFV